MSTTLIQTHTPEKLHFPVHVRATFSTAIISEKTWFPVTHSLASGIDPSNTSDNLPDVSERQRVYASGV